MTALAPDATSLGTSAKPVRDVRSGFAFALASALSFGMSGTLGKGLFDAGWSPVAAVSARIAIAALALAVPTALSLRGRWHLLLRNAPMVIAYGLIAVLGCQVAYFQAVSHMQVGLALLIEYTAPIGVVGWLWFRHGERPSRGTVLGGAIVLAGLVPLLDLFSGGAVSPLGVGWAFLAMTGVAVYFLLSAHDASGLPPLALAGSGLIIAAVVIGLADALGITDVRVSTADVTYGGHAVAWWIPVLLLGLVSAALAYVTGVEASRRLGSRLASFVAIFEVLTALVVAAILLNQVPTSVQVVGAVMVLIGVVIVKIGEPTEAP
ncbi:MAG TPA: DMT family transporter [Marmoricola sp.]|nr:DMT family transporter [Marmoricola sp.]